MRFSPLILIMLACRLACADNITNLFTGQSIYIGMALSSVPVASVDLPFGFYVDSVNGNDSNAGTNSTIPWKTIAKLMSMRIGTGATNIYLARGSCWREQLTITNHNQRIDAYGTGSMPLLDCSEVITGAWSKTVGQTYIYEKSLVWYPDTAWFRAWENSNHLVRVTSLANCDATAGSYYPSSDSASPATLYVHASDHGNPESNGKIYEYAKRNYGIDGLPATMTARTNSYISGIMARRNAGNNGSIQMCGTLVDCWAVEGSKHNIFVVPGSYVSGCVASNAYYGSGGNSMFVYFVQTSAGEDTTFTNCVAVNQTRSDNLVGVIGHNGSGGYFGEVKWLGGRIEGMGAGMMVQCRTNTVVGALITNCLVAIESASPWMNITNCTIYSTNQDAASRGLVLGYVGSTNNIIGTTIGSGYIQLQVASGVSHVRLESCNLARISAYYAPGPSVYARSNYFTDGLPIIVNSITNAVSLDYNSYPANAWFLAMDYNGGNEVHLPTWRTATGQDQNSATR